MEVFWLKKVAVIIDDFFEESEYFQPVGAFSAAGHKVINVGLKKGKIVKGKKQKREIVIDESIDDSSINDFDALLIPGGYSPDKLRSSQ